ncbi:MAG TPA: AMP-binding protein, partial [Blastocatellia bacterium]|nr:AMP-binding protein [Blastocatellia bacterium]
MQYIALAIRAQLVVYCVSAAAMNLVEFVFQAAREQSLWRRPAIFYKETTTSYEELLVMVRRFGGAAREAGLEKGDRVAIVAFDCPEFVAAFLGVQAVGAVAVPINTRLSSDSLSFVLRQCGARAIVISADQVEKISAIKSELPALRTV